MKYFYYLYPLLAPAQIHFTLTRNSAAITGHVQLHILFSLSLQRIINVLPWLLLRQSVLLTEQTHQALNKYGSRPAPPPTHCGSSCTIPSNLTPLLVEIPFQPNMTIRFMGAVKSLMIKPNSFGARKILKTHFSVVRKTSNAHETWTAHLALKPRAYHCNYSQPSSVLVPT